MTATDKATSLSRGQVWRAPVLTVLGDVGSLTETGSMMTSESPLNLCVQSINMTGTGCAMG